MDENFNIPQLDGFDEEVSSEVATKKTVPDATSEISTSRHVTRTGRRIIVTQRLDL